ncbi:MAG: hypothetical protein HY319_31430 [Armatimonadetes bacterium]|nr:hypothetical protein [Armatimonadota bacterium]
MVASRKWLFLILLASLPSMSWAQPAPPGGSFPPAREYPLPDYWLEQNAARITGEWVDPETELYWWDYPSVFDGNLQQRAPLLILRRPGALNLAVGSHRSLLADGLLDPIPVKGAWLEGDLGPLRLSATSGITTSENLPGLLIDPEGIGSFAMQGVGLAGPLGDGYFRLTRSHWDPATAPSGPAHRLTSLEIDPRLRGPFTFSGAYAMDDLPGVDLSLRDRRAFRWRFNLNLPEVTLSGSQRSQGRAYGPAHQDNFRRGDNLLDLEGRFQLAPGLQWFESFRTFSFETPLEQPQVSVYNQNFYHLLNWRPDPDFSLSASFLNNLSGQDEVASRSDTARLDAFWRVTPAWELIGRWGTADSVAAGVHSVTRLGGVQVTHLPAPGHRIGLRLDLVGIEGDRGLVANRQLGLTYSYHLPDDGGFLLADYALSDSALPGTATSTLSLRTLLRPAARWTVGGSYVRYQTSEPQATENYSLDLGYVLDEHNEIGLGYRFAPFQVDLLGPEPRINPAHIYTLELRNSWGGPVNRELHSRLLPRLAVEAYLRPAGRPEAPWQPLEGARVRLGQEEARKVGPDGAVRFDLEAGKYAVSLDTGQLGDNFQVEGGVAREVTLGPGERRQLRYEVTAWSSIYAVVWNDVDGLRQPPVGYIPFSEVPIRIVGGPEERTDPLGVARFRNLTEGDYLVALDREALPPGVTTTTPTQFEFHLSPGEEKVLNVGLRGFGRLAGRVLLLPPRGGPPVPAPGGVRLMVNRRPVGETDPEGRLDLELPAGRLQLTLDPRPAGSDLYLVGEDAGVLKLEPGQSATREFVLARYARIEAQLTLGAQSLPLSGVPVELQDGPFHYTDGSGKAVFDRLKTGLYTVSVTPEHVPPGYRLESPGRVQVELKSGDRQRVLYKLRRL